MRKVDASAKRALARFFWVVTWFAQRLNDRQPFAGNHYRPTGVLRPEMARATGFELSSLRKL